MLEAFLCVCVVLGISLFVLFTYISISRKLDKLLSKQTKLMSSDTPTFYNSNTYEGLLKDALDVLRTNAKTIASPYFYANNIQEILNILPQYIIVLKFARYTTLNDLATSSEAQKYLTKWYGNDYQESPGLNIPIDSYYTHYVITDIDKALELYKNNSKLVDDIISNVNNNKNVRTS